MVKFFQFKLYFVRNVMKKNSKKTLMIIALISIIACACPGCFLLIQGLGNLLGPIGTIQNPEDLLGDLAIGFSEGGWLICLSAVLIFIPFLLVIIAVLKRSEPDVLEALEPTGASKDDPLPPPS